MAYYLSKTLAMSFDAAVARTVEALKHEGFGIISQIDIQQTLKAKIGVDFPRYRQFALGGRPAAKTAKQPQAQ